VKAFLAAIGGPEAVSGLDAGQVTAFMVGHCRDRNTWSAKAMVTSLRAFLRFAHATERTTVPLAGAVPAVASWRPAPLRLAPRQYCEEHLTDVSGRAPGVSSMLCSALRVRHLQFASDLKGPAMRVLFAADRASSTGVVLLLPSADSWAGEE
jgi:hypothetical protein